MHSSRGSRSFQRIRGGQILQDSQQFQPSHPWLCDLEQDTIFEPQFPYIQSKRIRPDGLSPKSFSGIKCHNSVACCCIVALNLGDSDVIRTKEDPLPSVWHSHSLEQKLPEMRKRGFRILPFSVVVKIG